MVPLGLLGFVLQTPDELMGGISEGERMLPTQQKVKGHSVLLRDVVLISG